MSAIYVTRRFTTLHTIADCILSFLLFIVNICYLFFVYFRKVYSVFHILDFFIDFKPKDGIILNCIQTFC